MTKETKSLGQKDRLDRFYTKRATARTCIRFLTENIDLNYFETIIEPSAGDGAFSCQLPNCVAYDLDPQNEGIIKDDWFKVDKNQFKKPCLVIGNPPFGQQSKLALKFFNSCGFADCIAFILPLSFRKDSIQNRMNLDFFLLDWFELPKDSFILNGNDYSVPTVFQIWGKREGEKRTKKKLKY